MRRVLVPLDGSRLAEEVLPDALRFAGADGELILIRDASWTHVDGHAAEYSEWHAIEETERYLAGVTQSLQKVGARASAYRLTASDIASAIDDAASRLNVDMVACATHGRGLLGRFFFGGIVWKALAESRLPVLLHHPDELLQDGSDLEETQSESHLSERILRASQSTPRRVMVPLDGSHFAETAISMAEEVATEWKAAIYLARVVPDPTMLDSLVRSRDELQAEVDDARAYLDTARARSRRDVRIEVFTGDPVTRLIAAIDQWAITDVVMTSHGRTGLKRALFGSVADELIQRVHCPTVVIPPFALKSTNEVTEPAQQSEPLTRV